MTILPLTRLHFKLLLQSYSKCKLYHKHVMNSQYRASASHLHMQTFTHVALIKCAAIFTAFISLLFYVFISIPEFIMLVYFLSASIKYDLKCTQTVLQ